MIFISHKFRNLNSKLRRERLEGKKEPLSARNTEILEGNCFWQISKDKGYNFKRVRFKKIAFVLSVPIGLWLGGFGIFIYQIPHEVNDKTTSTDGIVVLTGRKGRVQLGFQLIQQGLGKKLFITGVHPTVKMPLLLSRQKVEGELRSDIPAQLGYKAQNTYGNAKETAQWIAEQNIYSIRLVTTNYHIRRSLFHFKRYLPASTLIIPHPIEEELKWDLKTFSLLWSEYHKLLRDYVKSLF
jgi:uncharacterized SAM-binding protein YcdF (DUF218 family)